MSRSVHERKVVRSVIERSFSLLKKDSNLYDQMDAQSIADTASCFSEEAEAPVAALYTCLSCQVAFKTPTDQRGHMRSDWHRYNLKRKVAELPPVSAQVFADKLEIIQQKGAPVNAPVSDRSNLECVTCR